VTRSEGALALALALVTSPAAAQDARTVRLELEHAAFVRDDAPEGNGHLPVGVDASQPLTLLLIIKP
jgi:hypothetical protein